MRILGISNPNFLGVTIATQAICTDWLPAPHMNSPYEWQKLSSEIFHKGPDVVVVGGWSRGYLQLLQDLKRSGTKSFPILSVSHSTQFHGSYFHDDWRAPEFEHAFKTGLLDILGFVHPQTAEYYQKVRKTFAVWVPHTFKPAQKIRKPDVFRIGILGTPQWYKNIEGPFVVARDFEADHARVEIVTSGGLNKPHEMFLATLNHCSVLVHMSHLECYSNTVQEAWARGVPVIMSPASSGLAFYNPLLEEKDKKILSSLQLDSATDPVQLYNALKSVKDEWDLFSESIHNSYKVLNYRTSTYLHGLFDRLIKDYPNREHDVGFFEAPFTKEGVEWSQLSL